MVDEMSHCLYLIVTSRAIGYAGDFYVVQIFVKHYLSNDWLEGSSVIMLLISLLLSVLMVCLCLLPRMVSVWQ